MSCTDNDKFDETTEAKSILNATTQLVSENMKSTILINYQLQKRDLS